MSGSITPIKHISSSKYNQVNGFSSDFSDLNQTKTFDCSDEVNVFIPEAKWMMFSHADVYIMCRFYVGSMCHHACHLSRLVFVTSLVLTEKVVVKEETLSF